MPILLQSQLGQAWMIGWPWSIAVPVELALRGFNRNIVDGRMTMRHQTVLVKLPILIACSNTIFNSNQHPAKLSPVC